MLLLGPPAGGKSTITQALHDLDPRFVLLRVLRVGVERGEEYHVITEDQLQVLRAAGRIILETRNGDRGYAIDAHPIDHMTTAELIPVVHVANCADLRSLTSWADWLSVLLWVPREVCEQRARRRGDPDVAETLKAWEEAAADIAEHECDGLFHLRLTTSRMTIEEAAGQIADAFTVLGRSPSREGIAGQRPTA
ncbi:hypothetical protein GCM10023259_098330 [Thermocatellispora tengchongensis]